MTTTESFIDIFLLFSEYVNKSETGATVDDVFPAAPGIKRERVQSMIIELRSDDGLKNCGSTTGTKIGDHSPGDIVDSSSVQTVYLPLA
mmetsp:Transcript_22388/g.59480  ORF Transcript_22388/g.59480 Transcript_22388/m.59480 type:complete len:89 (+) Transcript_22388:1-267(+)